MKTGARARPPAPPREPDEPDEPQPTGARPCGACAGAMPLPLGYTLATCAQCGRAHLVAQAPAAPDEPPTQAGPPPPPEETLAQPTPPRPGPEPLAADDDDTPPLGSALSGRRHRPPTPRAPPPPPSSSSLDGVLEVYPGVTLGGCRLVARIGAGGMGTVWLARQLSLDRNVAVKVLRSSLAHDPHFVAQFAHEALAAAQLVHHNIVQIYDTGQQGTVHYFSMEHVDGESLAAVLRREGRLDCEVAAGYVLQAARGVELAHHRGMIHRDLKPDNLLLNRDGIVKVADLGLVIRSRAAPGGGTAARPRGRLHWLGTPAYMAPEQATDPTRIDARADIYSLGCTLYKLVTGRAPFEADSVAHLLDLHQLEPPAPPESLNHRVPPVLSQIIMKSLAKAPQGRFATVTRLIQALESFLGVDSATGFSPREEHAALLEQAVAEFNRAARRWPRRLAALALLALTAAAGTVAVRLGYTRVAVGLAGVGCLGWLTNALIRGLLQRSPLMLTLRQLVLTASWWLWVLEVVVLGAAVAAVARLGVERYALGALVAGALCGLLFYLAVDRAPERRARAPLQAVEQMLKGMRLKGLEEQALRQFVCKYSGHDWEPFYEAIFGYEAKLAARERWGRNEKGQPRARHGVWRDVLIRLINRRLEARRERAAQRRLESLEKRAAG